MYSAKINKKCVIKMKFGLLLVTLAFSSDENKTESAAKSEDLIVVKIEEDEFAKVHKYTSEYIGVSYKRKKWYAQRRSKHQKKIVYNGSYEDEETAAHASDTLARNLMAKNEQNHKLNFPHDNTEVYMQETKPSKHIGVNYNESKANWSARRWSKKEWKLIYNGNYKDEETAAHASDTLARKLMENGEKNHMLNFPDDDTEVYREEKKTSAYIGVSYRLSRWRVVRYSKNEKKIVYNGFYEDEETAARASDTLAKQLMANGEQNHKLNFPNDNTEPQRNKRKRSQDENLEQL